jgi:hypothetical protein
MNRTHRWSLLLALATLTAATACTTDGAATTPPTTATTPPESPTTPSSAPSSPEPPSASPASGATSIRVVVGDRAYAAELYANPTARDLADQLPLTVAFDDLHGLEKTGPLPRALTTDGAPRGSDPEVGEIGYYAPGRDLVLYYGDVGYYPGIIRIGRFDGSIDALADEDDGFRARLERA